MVRQLPGVLFRYPWAMTRLRTALVPWLVLTGASLAQEARTLDAKGQWTTPAPREPDPERAKDAQTMSRARALLASGKADDAENLLSAFIGAPDAHDSPYFPEALYLRGSARLARRDEFDSLYDFERVVKEFPESEMFTPALEKELEVADLYLGGLRKRVLGMRVESGVSVAEEIILRINERLPGSALAEKALLRLADYYYEARDLPMAVETYDVFLSLYPRSVSRSRALQRRVYANIAQFKGPAHDAGKLVEAAYQIEDFQREFPLDAARLGMSDALLARLDESRAEQLLQTGRWYLDRDDPAGAKITLGRLIRTHPGTGAAQDALAIFTERGWPLPGAPKAAPGAEPAR